MPIPITPGDTSTIHLLSSTPRHPPPAPLSSFLFFFSLLFLFYYIRNFPAKRAIRAHPNIKCSIASEICRKEGMAQQRADPSFQPTSTVKGLRFGGQLMIKNFKVKRATPPEFGRLLCADAGSNPFPTAAAFIPTNFSILAQHAWHTLTLGLGTKKSKVVAFVFESEQLKSSVERVWPWEISLGEINKKLIRGLPGCEMARFKFRKGCITFYVYAVRRQGSAGFARAEDLKALLQRIVSLKDFMDHTAMLAAPHQRSIAFAMPVAVAH